MAPNDSASPTAATAVVGFFMQVLLWKQADGDLSSWHAGMPVSICHRKHRRGIGFLSGDSNYGISGEIPQLLTTVITATLILNLKSAKGKMWNGWKIVKDAIKKTSHHFAIIINSNSNFTVKTTTSFI